MSLYYNWCFNIKLSEILQELFLNKQREWSLLSSFGLLANHHFDFNKPYIVNHILDIQNISHHGIHPSHQA